MAQSLARLRRCSPRPMRGVLFLEPGPNLQSLLEPICRADMALPALRLASAGQHERVRCLHQEASDF
jgi:hypothetical protein